eukprot:13277.XXX_887345_887467_1 [CDS] Oithona nana genome sequencing.
MGVLPLLSLASKSIPSSFAYFMRNSPYFQHNELC